MFFLTSNELDVNFDGLVQELFGNFFRIAPWKRRFALLFFCPGVVDRQQPGAGGVLDIFFHRAGRYRNRNNLLWLALCTLRDIDGQLAHGQAGEPGNAYRLRQRRIECLTRARSDEAFFHFDCDTAILLWCAQRFRMHISVKFQLVIGDGEFGRLAAHAPDAFGLASELQQDAFFKLRAIDRMGEINIEHRAL